MGRCPSLFLFKPIVAETHNCISPPGRTLCLRPSLKETQLCVSTFYITIETHNCVSPHADPYTSKNLHPHQYHFYHLLSAQHFLLLTFVINKKKGKNMSRIFITGSADGLGQMAARLLVKAGHQVVLHARSEKRAQEALAAVPGAETSVFGDLSGIQIP